MNKFLIAGCGRSGTKYTAMLLRSLGISCGHERIFGFSGVRPWPANVDGDVSSLAPPFLHLRPKGALLFHIVRDPLKVVRSILARNGPASASVRHEKMFLVPAGFPDIAYKDDPMRWACETWLHRNALTEAAGPDMWFQIEALDVPKLREMLDLIGWHVPDKALTGALGNVPRNVNKGRQMPPLSWDDVPDDLQARMIRMAERYGYRQAE